MTKKIAITCNDYKTKKWREGLLKDGFKLEYDGESGIKNIHLFRIEVAEKDFDVMAKRITKTIQRLEIEFKQSN